MKTRRSKRRIRWGRVILAVYLIYTLLFNIAGGIKSYQDPEWWEAKVRNEITTITPIGE